MRDEKRYDLRQMVCLGLFGALALALPMAFHMVSLGRMFLPLFQPIAVASFLLQLRYSLTLCLLIPLLSFALSGMPPLLVPPVGAIMIMELAVLCFCNHLFYRRMGLGIHVSAVLSVVIDRIAYVALLFVLADLLEIPKVTFTFQAAVKSFPGLILLVTLVPSATLAILRIPFFESMRRDIPGKK